MPFELRNDAGITISIRDNGAVESIRAGAILVNQVLGSDAEGGLGNLYVRRLGPDRLVWTPVMGPRAGGRFGATPSGARWEGTLDGVDFSCSLQLAPGASAWRWTVRLTNRGSDATTVDAVLAQDVGLAAEAAVRTSELYTSQYIDHTALDHPSLGYILCSRQNLPQDGAAQWLLHACLEGAAGYLTDGFQLYGPEYRATGVPAALSEPSLPNQVLQYEVALPTLASRPVVLEPGGSAELTFVAVFEPDHPAASGPEDASRIRDAATAFTEPVPDDGIECNPVSGGRFATAALFAAQDLSEADVARYFGTERRHEERADDQLLSFFHGDGEHVVLRAKELRVERPTGHIMLSGTELHPIDDRLAVTAWMTGAFGSQLTLGNTSFHKLLSVVRNPLNVLRSGGQRIFVRDAAGREKLLGVPSAFEMGLNSARWIYRGSDRTIVVCVSTSLDDPMARLEVDVEQGGPIEIVVTHHLVLGEHEGGPQGDIEIDGSGGRVRMRPAKGTMLADRYPDATFFLVVGDSAAVRSIELDAEHLVVATEPVTRFELAITGSIVDAAAADARAGRARDGRDDARDVSARWRDLVNGLSVGGASNRAGTDLGRLDDTLRWYAHNAMVHFVSPHGLEQSGGAAWGVRDVCQGPVEFLVATGNAASVREILRIVYEHQDHDTGDWPQWFMFDRYRELQQADSHGDVIHWPLKALCDYVEATNDVGILDEEVGWTDRPTGRVLREVDPIVAHVERQIARIEADVIPGTALPIYGGGDWEDTLQPANPDLARHLVSAWTTELAYQTLLRFAEVSRRARHDPLADRATTLATRMRADFNRWLVPDGVVAGLASFAGDEVEYFLHPRDRATGVEYRLLPMTRGMISGMFTPEQARDHLGLIDRHLLFPDGVRLMNRPMAYRGGPSRTFKRAESAANFGREIGLQYVHAHIRYIEAMAKLGRPEQAFRGLMTICPVGIQRDVPSALPRQSNAYFSSSDAAFATRYDADRDFERLRTGDVGVKGGWRIYSSGPGIYIHQVVSNVLGVRSWFGDVLLDPVLPRTADGATLDLAFEDRPVRYRFHVDGDGFGPAEVRVNGRSLAGTRDERNPYRTGGLLIAREAFAGALDGDRNEVDIAL